MRPTRTRELTGSAEKLVLGLSVGWVIFHLWYSSTLPYMLDAGILNSTERRSISLAIAMFLALFSYSSVPGKGGNTTRPWEIAWALLGAGTAAYLYIFYDQLASRVGQPSPLDLAAGTIGLVLLLDAIRRAVALPVALAALAFLIYAIVGPAFLDRGWAISFERILVHY